MTATARGLKERLLDGEWEALLDAELPLLLMAEGNAPWWEKASAACKASLFVAALAEIEKHPPILFHSILARAAADGEMGMNASKFGFLRHLIVDCPDADPRMIDAADVLERFDATSSPDASLL